MFIPQYCIFFLIICTVLFIFFNQKNKPHVSGKEARYLEALLWVAGYKTDPTLVGQDPWKAKVLVNKHRGRLGPGYGCVWGWEGRIRGVGQAPLWPPWTRVVPGWHTAKWDGAQSTGRSLTRASQVADAVLHLVPGAPEAPVWGGSESKFWGRGRGGDPKEQVWDRWGSPQT